MSALGRFVELVDRLVWNHASTIHDAAVVSRTERDLRRIQRRFPIASIVRCRCGRCTERDPAGRLWRVHSYDAETCELRVYDAGAPWQLLRQPWPIPGAGGRGDGIEVTWLSVGTGRHLSLVELPWEAPA